MKRRTAGREPKTAKSRLISPKKVCKTAKKYLQCLAESAKIIFCEAAREAIRKDR
jgi:hypothetical protein